MAKSKTVFVCSECGNESTKWLGKCPACNSWNTFYEQKIVETKNKEKCTTTSVPQKLNSYQAKETLRAHTGFNELDRVLGGGLVKGSLVLLGGEPRNSESQLLFCKFVIKLKVTERYYMFREKNQQSRLS